MEITVNHCESVYETLHRSNPNYMGCNQGIAVIYDWIHLLKDANGDVHSPWEDKRISVLEVGCGNGRLCDFLSDLLIDVTGLDVADGGYDRSKYKFIKYNLNNLPLPFAEDEFDYCLAFDILEHMLEEKVPPLLAEFARVSRNVIIKVACYGGPPLHLTVKSPGWWLNTLLNSCPGSSWQMLRSHQRFITKYAPLFYGKKKKELKE